MKVNKQQVEPMMREVCPSDKSQTIPTHAIKSFVLSRLPPNHPLRQVILAEKENLTREEFLAKMEVWLILLNQKS